MFSLCLWTHRPWGRVFAISNKWVPFLRGIFLHFFFYHCSKNSLSQKTKTIGNSGWDEISKDPNKKLTSFSVFTQVFFCWETKPAFFSGRQASRNSIWEWLFRISRYVGIFFHNTLIRNWKVECQFLWRKIVMCVWTYFFKKSLLSEIHWWLCSRTTSSPWGT